MSAKPSEYISVAHLCALGKTYVAGAMGPGVHQSFPLPVLLERKLAVLFLFSRAEIVEPKAGCQIWPPQRLAYLCATTGNVLQVRSLDRGAAAAQNSSEAPLGSWLTPVDRMQDEFLTLQSQLLQSLDAVLPAFALSAAVGAEQQPAFRLLRDRLVGFLEPPLLPYYKSYAGPFLQWLGVPVEANAAR